MDLVSAIRHQPPSLKAFYLQYLSLVLIVLTVIAGTMTQRHFRYSQEHRNNRPKLEDAVHAISPWSALHKVPQNLSENSSEGAIAAWRTILSDHDVVLEIELEVNSIERGFDLARDLRLMLLENERRADALRISFLVREADAPEVMRERWRREERFEGETSGH